MGEGLNMDDVNWKQANYKITTLDWLCTNLFKDFSMWNTLYFIKIDTLNY